MSNIKYNIDRLKEKRKLAIDAIEQIREVSARVVDDCPGLTSVHPKEMSTSALLMFTQGLIVLYEHLSREENA